MTITHRKKIVKRIEKLDRKVGCLSVELRLVKVKLQKAKRDLQGLDESSDLSVNDARGETGDDSLSDQLEVEDEL